MMKKNTLIYILIFVVAASLAVWLMSKEDKSTLPIALSNFAVKDTGDITSVRLTDKDGGSLVLGRKSAGTWMINDQYVAQPSQIRLFLETIRLVNVKGPVPLAARDNVIRDMAASSTKVEIFKGDKLVKTYYVGGTTSDELGTYMLLEGSSEPFITEIQGFYGYLSSRYRTDPITWRSTEIYHLHPPSIRSVEIVYPHEPAASFRLTVENDEYLVQQLPEGSKLKLSALEAKRLLAGFNSIDFEQFPPLTHDERDSILQVQPAAIIKVTADNANAPVLTLYPKRADVRTKEVGQGNYDLDKFYGTISPTTAPGGEGVSSREIVLVQKFVLEKILASYGELTD